LWGIQQHFHPNLDPASPEWAAALPAALDGAARAADPEAFRRVLCQLLAPLQDTWTVNVTHRGDPPSGTLPVSWAWVEDRLVITGASGDLRPGDVVVTLDGQPARPVLTEAGGYVAALPAAYRWLALDLLAQGPVGSRVELGVERAGSAPFQVTLARTAADPPPDTPFAAVAEPRPGVIYVDLRRSTDADLDKLWPR